MSIDNIFGFDSGYYLDSRDHTTIVTLLKQAQARNVEVTSTKLVKLLYILDLRRAEEGREPLTSVQWKWLKFGPFNDAIYRSRTQLKNMKIIEEEQVTYQSFSGIYEATVLRTGPNVGLLISSATEELIAEIDSVLDEYGAMNATTIKDYTYTTAPMLQAQAGGSRGVDLDMAAARKRVLPDLSKYKRILEENPAPEHDDPEAIAEIVDEIACSRPRIAHATRRLLDA